MDVQQQINQLRADITREQSEARAEFKALYKFIQKHMDNEDVELRNLYQAITSINIAVARIEEKVNHNRSKWNTAGAILIAVVVTALNQIVRHFV